MVGIGGIESPVRTPLYHNGSINDRWTGSGTNTLPLSIAGNHVHIVAVANHVLVSLYILAETSCSLLSKLNSFSGNKTQTQNMMV
jgi:hypothetical protein